MASPMIETPAGLPERHVWGVSALLLAVSDALTARFGASAVRGELSGFSRASSGHCYFNLKDADRGEGALRCAMFRRAATLLDFEPADGQRVDVRGRLGIYGPRGELQLVVESMQRTGAGALYEQFVRLRAALEREGLFKPDRKRPLPAFPRRIGIVTSRGAAALHDVTTALARRAPQVEVVLYPSAVQGAEAPAALCAAIALASARREVDVLIVCRGGGALEDLWAFNDERVVRALVGATMPVVCGVGHETDVTLADLAADLRAPTPTAAAELAAPSQRSCLDLLTGLDQRRRRAAQALIDLQGQRLDRTTARFARPTDALRRQGQRIDTLGQRLAASTRRGMDMRCAVFGQAEGRLRRSVGALLSSQATHLRTARERLDGLDPRRVLARGYALLMDPVGHALVSIAEVVAGASVQAHLADGRLDLDVTAVRKLSRAEDRGPGEAFA